MLWAAAARADTIDEPGEPLPYAPLPQGSWFTLQTPHFNIHFYRDEADFAERVAHFAERAYRLNTRYLNWRPSGRVTVVLSDTSDEANGSASSIPYTFINAYGVPPDSLDELNDFDDYMKLLITHEFTHVVHLDTMLSICPLAINTVLGRTYAPNLAEPTWFIEGMAVLLESRQTTAGRLRSSFYDMHLRVAVPRRPDVPPRSDLVDPQRLPAGDRRLPLRLEPAPLHRGPLRPAQDPRDLPPLRRHLHPGRPQSDRDQGGRERLRRNLRPRPLGRLAPSDRPSLHAAGRGRQAAAAHHRHAPHLGSALAAQRGSGAAVLARRHAGLSPQQQRSVPGLRPPRSHDRRAPADRRHARGRTGGPHARRPGADPPAGELPAAPAAAGDQLLSLLERSLSARSGERHDPPAHARPARARAGRLARRNPDRLRAGGDRRPAAGAGADRGGRRARS